MMPANVKFAATRAVSLKALCNAVYVSATITLLGWLPLVLFLVHGPGMAWAMACADQLTDTGGSYV